MSTRSQVKFVSKHNTTPIYLYQHSDGYALYKIVCNAISKRLRWEDPDYLCRIIFSEMINTTDSWCSETGYGIGIEQAGDIEFLIEVNTDGQTITEWKGYDKNFSIKSQCKFNDARATKQEDLYKINYHGIISSETLYRN